MSVCNLHIRLLKRAIHRLNVEFCNIESVFLKLESGVMKDLALDSCTVNIFFKFVKFWLQFEFLQVLRVPVIADHFSASTFCFVNFIF